MRIKTKIAIASLIITILSLSLLFLFIYFGMSKLLYSALDRNLTQIASNIEGNFVEEYYERDQNEEAKMELVAGGNYWLKVINENGETMETSLLGEKIDIPIKLDRVHNGYFNIEVKTEKFELPGVIPASTKKITFRTYVKRIKSKFFKGWLIVALPIEEIKKSQSNLVTVGIFGIILISIITAVFTFIFTGKVLNPLERIAVKASQIGKDDIEEGIFEEGGNDEIGMLSKALNNMLLRLKKAIESQKRFISDASHELKTPISILRAHWENEINNPDLSIKFKRKLTKDIEVLSRMSSMIEDLLILARTEEKGKNIKRIPFSLNELMKELIEDARILTDSKHQELVYSEGEEITLPGDRMLLYRLFLNLIKNSVEYTPEGGKISIAVDKEGNYARVQIKDNGMGIPAKELPYIFERFYRVESSRAKSYGGAGLGLSIAKWITEAHGGKISIESKEGEGTTVTVLLPVN